MPFLSGVDRPHPRANTRFCIHVQVKRGVVPPCPASYSRKIYGSGPRFMSQDDGSDSEPELVVQSKGHWEKNLGVRGWRTREIIRV